MSTRAQQRRMAIVLAVMLAGLLAYPTPSVHAATFTGEQWRVVEIPLTSSKSYANPFLDVNITGTFSGPGGTVITRPGYWDGGNSWKVRFAPTKVGAWSYTITATDTTNTGLHNQTGTIQANLYSGSLEIYKRGFLKRSDNNRYLTYADGTPFFWLSDDTTIFTKARLDTTNKPSWNPPVANPGSQWKGTIDRIVSQKYSLVQLSLLSTHPSASYWVGTRGNLVNVDYFRNNIDPKLKFVADSGLVSGLSIGYHSEVDDQYGGVEPIRRLARYAVARYGAYPTVWEIVEPDQYDVQTRIDRWRQVGLDINALDSYNHPQAVWYWATAYGRKPTHYLYDNPRWIDVVIHQGGHGSDSSYAAWPTDQHRWYYDNLPAFPMVEAGGYNFEKLYAPHDDRVVRYSLYRAFQSGSFGAGYGGQGLWNWAWDNNDTGDDFSTPDNHHNWLEAVDYPGAAQMAYLQTFYTNLPWHQLVPRANGTGWASWPVSTSDYGLPTLKASDGGRTVAVFFPSGYYYLGSSGTLYNLSAPRYNASWFDPRTGAYTPIGSGFAPSGGQWAIPQKPDLRDWLLWVQASTDPFGYHDGATGDYTYGWACDADDFSAALDIHFYLDGPYGSGTFVGFTRADQSRSDLAALCGGYAAHFFNWNYPANIRDGRTHTIYAYAINASGTGGVNRLLTNTPKTVLIPSR